MILQFFSGMLRRPAIQCMLLIACGLAAYGNTFRVPFQFDDFSIYDNPVVKDLRVFLSPGMMKGTPEYGYLLNRPVGYLTFALNYRLHGLSVFGYHVVNLAIHITNALLVFVLVRLCLKSPKLQGRGPVEEGQRSLLPLAAAAVFVAHPLQTQAVTYIVQRLASLATLFFLLSLVSYAWWRSTTDTEDGSGGEGRIAPRGAYLASVISAVLAMKTKEMSFTLPIVIALYEFAFHQGRAGRRLLYLAPLAATLVIVPLTVVDLGSSPSGMFSAVDNAARVQTEMGRWGYLVIQCRVVVTYLRVLFLPINQNVDYDYPEYWSFMDGGVAVSAALLLVLAAAGAWLLVRYRTTAPLVRLATFGIFWFFITLSVESSIIPVKDVIFEHRVYLPAIGLIIAACALVVVVTEAAAARLRRIRPTVAVLSVLAILGLATATYARNEVWESPVSLWYDVIEKSPKKGRSFNALGSYFMEQKDCRRAVEYYLGSVERHPYYADLYVDLGVAYECTGAASKAVAAFERAIYLDSYIGKINVKAHMALGELYAAKGDRALARREYEQVLAADPYNVLARHRLMQLTSEKK